MKERAKDGRATKHAKTRVTDTRVKERARDGRATKHAKTRVT